MIDTGNTNHPVHTPVKLPTRHVTRAVSVEQNFNRFRVADNLVVSPVVVRVRLSVKESKSCAISISECDGIMFSFALKVSETDPDGVVLGNLDFLDNVEVVEISAGEVRRCQDTRCWQFWHLSSR